MLEYCVKLHWNLLNRVWHAERWCTPLQTTDYVGSRQWGNTLGLETELLSVYMLVLVLTTDISKANTVSKRKPAEMYLYNRRPRIESEPNIITEVALYWIVVLWCTLSRFSYFFQADYRAYSACDKKTTYGLDSLTWICIKTSKKEIVQNLCCDVLEADPQTKMKTEITWWNYFIAI